MNARLRGLAGSPGCGGYRWFWREGETRQRCPGKDLLRPGPFRPLETCAVDSELEGVRRRLGRLERRAF